MVDKKEIRCYNKVNYRTEGSDHMQQVISVGNQDFKSIREKSRQSNSDIKVIMENLLYGKQIEEKHYDAQLLAKGMKKEKIRTLWFCLLWKESTDRKIRKRCHNRIWHLFFYTKKKFQMKIKIIMNQIY